MKGGGNGSVHEKKEGGVEIRDVQARRGDAKKKEAHKRDWHLCAP